MASVVIIRHTTDAQVRLFALPDALSTYALPTIVINKHGRKPTRGTDLEVFPAKIALFGQFLLGHTHIDYAEINQKAFRVCIDDASNWSRVEIDIMNKLSRYFSETLEIIRDLTQVAHLMPDDGVKLQGQQ